MKTKKVATKQVYFGRNRKDLAIHSLFFLLWFFIGINEEFHYYHFCTISNADSLCFVMLNLVEHFLSTLKKSLNRLLNLDSIGNVSRNFRYSFQFKSNLQNFANTSFASLRFCEIKFLRNLKLQTQIPFTFNRNTFIFLEIFTQPTNKNIHTSTRKEIIGIPNGF